jgi:tetratricopeptide (TPR) repeat protein
MAQQEQSLDDSGDLQAPDERAPGLARARALIESGEYSDAEQALVEIAASDDAPFGVFRQLNRVLLRQRKVEQALAAAREAAQRFPEIPGGRTMLAGALIRADKLEEAAECLAEACDDFPDNVDIWLVHGRTALLRGAKEQALEAISRACELAPGSVTERLWKSIALAAAGKPGQAANMFRRLSGHAEDFETICTVLFAQRSRTGSRADMLDVAEFAAAQLPDSAPLRICLADLLMESQNPERALAALDSVSPAALAALPKSTAYRAFEIRAEASKAVGDVSGAIAALEEMHRLRPEIPNALNRLYKLALETGRAEEARAVGRRINSMGAKKLPPDLSQALEELRAKSEPIAETTTGLDWAWEIADRSDWDRDAWRRAIDWGNRASKLMLRVWLTDATRNAEIDALFAPVDRSALDALPREGGCLVAGTHLGPVAAGAYFATTGGRRFRVFGKGGPEAIVGDGPPLRIPSDSNRSRSLREIVRELDGGGMVGFAAELPKTDEGRRLQFLGREIPFSTLAPRMIWNRRVPSLWWQPLWKDGRIVMEIERLPDPANGDTFDTWFERWSGAYLERLARVMRGNPENLNLPISIWQSAGESSSPSNGTV